MKVIHLTSLGVRQKKYETRDVSKIHTLVIHITGVGIYNRVGESGIKTPLDAAAHVYRTVMSAGPHEVVGDDAVLILCPKELAAHHVGGPKVKATWPQPTWHKQYLQNMAGAAEAFKLGWSAKSRKIFPSVNNGSYGIELISPPNAVTGLFTDQQLANLCSRVAVILHETPSIQQIVTHSFLAPATRSTKTNPWDLPPRLSKQVLEALATIPAVASGAVSAYLGPTGKYTGV